MTMVLKGGTVVMMTMVMKGCDSSGGDDGDERVGR